jgi:glutamine amidotransferase
MTISIVDYEMGNLRSVQKGFEQVGAEARIIDTAAQIGQAEKLVLPGVGGFGDAARTLRDRGMIDPILDFVGSGRPFLGICLGLQLLFDVSYEDGEHTGLGLIRGKVVRFSFESNPPGQRLKVPHMGWNQLSWDEPIPLLDGLSPGCYVYFVHSYYVVPEDDDVKKVTCDYGGKFTAMIWKDNIFAAQFHPEKSQKIGLKILENFAKL